MGKAARYLRKLARERVETNVAEASAGAQLRRYGAPWKGELVLVCEKCSRRLAKDGDPEQLGDVSRVLRTVAKEDGLDLRVVETGCLKLCPRDGITITTESMLASRPAQATIVRTREDVATLYQELQTEDRRRRHQRG